MLEALGVLGDLTALGNIQVVGHARVEWEHRRGSTDLGTHVADCSHTSARERFDTGTSVLDDSASTTLDRKNASDLKNNIYNKR